MTYHNLHYAAAKLTTGVYNFSGSYVTIRFCCPDLYGDDTFFLFGKGNDEKGAEIKNSDIKVQVFYQFLSSHFFPTHRHVDGFSALFRTAVLPGRLVILRAKTKFSYGHLTGRAL